MTIEQCELEVPRHGEVFTHDDGEGHIRTFCVAMMNTFCDKYEKAIIRDLQRVWLPIEDSHVKHIRARMGVEQDRLDRLKAPYLYRPCIGVLMHSSEHGQHCVIVDGNHRLVKLHGLGVREYRCAVFGQSLWEQFLIAPPLPDNWRDMRSGVLEHEKEKANG